MRAIKIAFYAILFVSILPFVFSIGLYESNGDFTFYTSNTDPLISVNITSPQEPVDIEKAELTYNGEKREVVFSGRRVNPGGKETVNLRYDDFGFSTPVSEDDVSFYKLYATGIDGNAIDPFGDPTEFDIVLDSTIPSVVTPIDGSSLTMSSTDTELDFTFSEDISSFAVKINGVVLQSYSNPSIFLVDYVNTYSYTVDLDDLNEGINTLSIEFRDIAGNIGTADYTILFIGDLLKISVMSRIENQSLGFFYDEQYPDLFGGKIYYRDEPFDFIFETNKAAKCYISYSLLSFLELDEVSNSSKTEIASRDGLRHSELINNIGSQKVWIACQSISFPDDIAYLGADIGLGQELLTFEKYDGNLEIVYALPEVTVSSQPFNFNVLTSELGICRSKLDGEAQIDMTTDDFLNHVTFDVSTTIGNHVALFSCFDRIGDVVTEKNTFNIDTENGARIISYTPEYLETASTPIEVTLSEDVECKYSAEPISTGNYDSAQALSGTGIKRTFTPSGLIEGDNYYYVVCNRNGELFSNTVKLIYDPNGPVLSNLTFVNIGVKSDYVGSTNRIKFEFEVESIIPVDKYFVTISSPNETLVREVISGTKGDLKEDIEKAVRISIIGQNRLGRNSSILEKAIKFDLTPPVITFTQVGEKVTIGCFDDESGCFDTDYGLSLTAINCIPRINYPNSSTEIRPFDNNYVCAEVRDKVGNEARDQKLLNPRFETDENDSVSGDGGVFRNITGPTNESNSDGQDSDDSDSGDGNQRDPSTPVNSDPFDFDAPDIPVEEEGFPWLILAAILLLLGGIGGGGYYAYRKGYLDDQLKKFGIVRPGSKDDKRSSGSGKGTTSFNTRKSTRPETAAERKRRYDKNLSKLNRFIDDTLQKGSDVFDKFTGVDKGKVKGYDDTLIKETPEMKKKKYKGKMSQDEFDEFYDKSKGKGVDGKLDSTTEKEAEAFENYYKTKKTTNKKE